MMHAMFKEANPWPATFDKHIIIHVPSELDEQKVVDHKGRKVLVLWGGEDISPSIYGQKKEKETHASERLGLRDILEIELAKEAKRMHIPILGICRGAQLMCAMAGGSLIQHVIGHAGPDHAISTKSGVECVTNSVHHQMMNPDRTNHELIAWAKEKISPVYINYPNAYLKDWLEPEIVYFPEWNALCIQGHPEYSSASDPFVDYCEQLILKYLLSPKVN
jgi:gamma-glutamyl-gamma-aminobutyrate hydrolase PuuD